MKFLCFQFRSEKKSKLPMGRRMEKVDSVIKELMGAMPPEFLG